MKIDLSFRSNYTLEVLEELATGERYYYPDATTVGGKDGLLVKIVSSAGRSWVGVFSFGQISPNSISGVYSTPHPDKFCVVSRGAGYIVSSSNPKDWLNVKAIPIIDVRPIKYQGILVFADYTELVAYNNTGLKWRTERLSYDSLKITEVTEVYIKGEFWDIRSEEIETFKIDLGTGSQIGGVKKI